MVVSRTWKRFARIPKAFSTTLLVPVVKCPLFIAQTHMALWFPHGVLEGEGIVTGEEVGYILVVIG